MPKASRSSRHKQKQNAPASQEPQANASSAVVEEARPRRRVREMSPRTRLISLVTGDILCFLIFASLGTSAHSKGVNFLLTIWVALPFVGAWFLVAPFLGAFRADIALRPGKMLIRTALCWLATWPLAMFLRWLLVERVTGFTLNDFVSFSVVVLITNLIILSAWRWPFSLNNSLRKRGV
ncbi:MAG TPA: DUF3054 domain-containing protein [Ktedonobacteraceae bacterium]